MLGKGRSSAILLKNSMSQSSLFSEGPLWPDSVEKLDVAVELIPRKGDFLKRCPFRGSQPGLNTRFFRYSCCF
jgi:hypothetical protein